MPDGLSFKAPFACAEFTVRWKTPVAKGPVLRADAGGPVTELKEVPALLQLIPGSWCREGEDAVACFPLPKGSSRLKVA